MFEAFGPLVGSTCVSFRGCVGRTWLGLEVDVQGYGGGGATLPFLCYCQAINGQLRTGADKGTPTV